jgi:hypothetical protein
MLFQIANLNGVLLWRSAHAPKTLISVDEGYGEHNINSFRWRTLVYTQETKRRRVIVAERVDIRYQLAESVILESIIPVLIVLPMAVSLVLIKPVLILRFGLCWNMSVIKFRVNLACREIKCLGGKKRGNYG